MLFSPTYVPYSYKNTANMREQLYLQRQLSQTSNSTDNIRIHGRNTGLIYGIYKLTYVTGFRGYSSTRQLRGWLQRVATSTGRLEVEGRRADQQGMTDRGARRDRRRKVWVVADERGRNPFPCGRSIQWVTATRLSGSNASLRVRG